MHKYVHHNNSLRTAYFKLQNNVCFSKNELDIIIIILNLMCEGMDEGPTKVESLLKVK